MDTVVALIFFTMALLLLTAALLSPAYVIYSAVQQHWPQWCPAPAWRWSLYCVPGTLLYCWWLEQGAGWLVLSQHLLVGVLIDCAILLPLTMGYAWYQQQKNR